MPSPQDQEYSSMHYPKRTSHDSFESPVEGFTLADYVVAFLCRWKLFVAIMAIFLVGGGMVVFWQSRPSVPFPYTTVVEIGRFANGTPLEDLGIVRARLETAYIPKVLSGHAAKDGYEQEQYEVLVDITNGRRVIPAEDAQSDSKGIAETGTLVLLKTLGGEQDREEILSIHQDIVNLLLQDHERKAELVKRDLEREKFQAEIKLDELKGRKSFFPRRNALLDDTAKLLQTQINTTSELVSSMEKDRSTALVTATLKGTVDQALATALLLVDTDITRNREKIRELEERLSILVPKDRAVLEQEELDNERAQKEQEQILSEIEFKVSNIQKTALVLPPSRLLKGPKQIPWQKIMAIAAVTGLAVGFFMVWIVELAVNAKRYVHVSR